MSRVFIVAVPDEVENEKLISGAAVIFSGVGKINVTIAACTAANKGYKEIINIGSCGSLHLPPGEIVKVGSVFQDIDCTPLCEYGETVFDNLGGQIILDDLELTSCFTTDYFFDINQKEKYSSKYLEMLKKCTIFDMEAFAIAKVCKYYDIKFNAYKWVSDDGDSENWKENCKIGFNKFKEKFK